MLWWWLLWWLLWWWLLWWWLLWWWLLWWWLLWWRTLRRCYHEPYSCAVVALKGDIGIAWCAGEYLQCYRGSLVKYVPCRRCLQPVHIGRDHFYIILIYEYCGATFFFTAGECLQCCTIARLCRHCRQGGGEQVECGDKNGEEDGPAMRAYHRLVTPG